MTRREATLRAAASAGLASIALVHAIGLPELWTAEGTSRGIASAAVIVLSVGLAWALAAAQAGDMRLLWRVVAVAAAAVVAATAAPEAFPVPGLADSLGGWARVAAALLGAVCLVAALAAAGARRAAVRELASALVALWLTVGTLHLAGVHGASHAATGHGAAHASFESAIRFRPGSGRRGDHFVVPVATERHRTALGLTLLVAAAVVFTYGAVGALRRGAPASTSP